MRVPMGFIDKLKALFGGSKEEPPSGPIRDESFEYMRREQILKKELEEAHKREEMAKKEREEAVRRERELVRREEELRKRMDALEETTIHEKRSERREVEESMAKKEGEVNRLEAEIQELKGHIDALKKAKPEPVEASVRAIMPSGDEELKKLPFGPYSFRNFIVGRNNKFVYTAAEAVAEMPADAYNPLFIFGDVGLGKTHLLRSIANHITQADPGMRVVYATSEEFTNELIEAVEEADLEGFREKYRGADVLIVDDIQFLAGEPRTQEEFFHTFNTLYDAHRQIILSSDRPPGEIATLEARLRSRFEGGLITDIKPPDAETRKSILEYEVSKRDVDLPDEVIGFIAQYVKSSIRTLKGALNRVIVYLMTNDEEPSIEAAQHALKGILLDTGVQPRPVERGRKRTEAPSPPPKEDRGTEEVATTAPTAPTASEKPAGEPARGAAEEVPGSRVGVKDVERYREKIREWKLQGYITNRLERMLDEGKVNPAVVESEFEEFENNLQKLEVLETRLKGLEGEGFDEELRELREKMLNPDSVDEVEDDIRLLEEKVRGHRELMLAKQMEELKRKGEMAKKELQSLKDLAKKKAED